MVEGRRASYFLGRTGDGAHGWSWRSFWGCSLNQLENVKLRLRSQASGLLSNDRFNPFNTLAVSSA